MRVIESVTFGLLGMRFESSRVYAKRHQVVVAGTFGTEIHPVTVPAFSMTLFGVTGAASTLPLQIQVQNGGPAPRSTAFMAFASSVDNITGDAWTTLGSNLPGTF